MNTVVEYLYRDAANFKKFGEVVFRGAPSSDELRRLRAALIGGEWILADRVNLPVLAPWMRGEQPWDETTDHTYHELVWPPRLTTRTPDPPGVTFATFVRRVELRNHH